MSTSLLLLQPPLTRRMYSRDWAELDLERESASLEAHELDWVALALLLGRVLTCSTGGTTMSVNDEEALQLWRSKLVDDET